MIDIFQSALDFEQEDPSHAGALAYISSMRSTHVNCAAVQPRFPAWWPATGDGAKASVQADPQAAGKAQAVAEKVSAAVARAALSRDAVRPIVTTFTSAA